MSRQLLVLGVLLCICYCSASEQWRGEQDSSSSSRRVSTEAVTCNFCDINNGGCDAQATCTCRIREVRGAQRPVPTCTCLSGWHGNGVVCTNHDQTCRDDSQCSPGMFCERANLSPRACHSNTQGTCRVSKCQSDTTFCAEKNGEGEGQGERLHLPAGQRTCIDVGENQAQCVQGNLPGQCTSCECSRLGLCQRVGGGFCKDTDGSCLRCGTTGDRCSMTGRCACGLGDACSGIQVCLQGRCCSQTTCRSTSDCCGSDQCLNGQCRPLYAVCTASDCSNNGVPSTVVPNNVVPYCQCTCNEEFTGTYCQTAMNQCTINNGGCDSHATCTPGAPGQATCACNAGWTGSGMACSDVNECLTNWAGCSHYSVCTNTPGSFSCQCNCGFESEGSACTDINECAISNGGCDAHATCTNNLGFRLCACNTGYADAMGAPPGFECVISGPCAVNNGGCDPNAMCTAMGNTPVCTCNMGYDGSGIFCTHLMALFQFEDGVNPAVDSSLFHGSYDITGTGVALTPGMYDQGAQFTPPYFIVGPLPGIGLGNTLLGDCDYTIMAWVYFPATVVTTHSDGIAGWGQSMTTDALVAFRSHYPRDYSNWYFQTYWWGDDFAASVGAITGQTWYHVTTTYDHVAFERKFYFNGVLKEVNAPTGHLHIPLAGYPLTIGWTQFDGEYFEGKMDDVAVFNVALSQADITTAMNGDFTPWGGPGFLP